MNKLYSSFSQTKGLLWRREYDAILKGDFLPPVGAVLDLTDKCNLACDWCNSAAFRKNNMLPLEHVKHIVDDLADWGARSLCFAGGGEGSLHPNYAEIIEYTIDAGLEVGISTNGVSLTEEALGVIAKKARFCGFSVDAGNSATWIRIKHGSLSNYSSMLRNAGILNEYARDSLLDSTFKVMLVPDNQYEVLQACVLAKSLGFKSFFVRPAAFENVPCVQGNFTFDVEAVSKQLDQCRVLESERFSVYSSFGRVMGDFHRKNDFNRCRCTPVIGVYCADGYCYLCIDMRERSYARMCKHLELRKFWNSPKHHKMIREIDLNKCPRCAFAYYNMQLEAYGKDFMYVNFP